MQPCNPIGYVHSLESFGSVDGPGVRFVVFLQGCALRCKYCHNPETWAEGGEEWTAEALFQRVYRYRNYWGKKGGITVSGGEPLRQLDFLTEFFTLARAKGVSENNIALHHVFRNAMVPLVQYIPSAFLNTVVGSIYIESLYSIPGMGGLLVTCVQRHDNTMVQGIVLLYACVGIVGLILGDILMVLIDPRINFGKKEGGR